MQTFYSHWRDFRWFYPVVLLSVLSIVFASSTLSYGAWLGDFPTTASVTSYQQLTG